MSLRINSLFLLLLSFLFSACSLSNQNLYSDKELFENKVKTLSLQIEQLSSDINKHEAKDIAYSAINYSKKLAKDYKVETPALFHNTLINMNLKSRGLCYHYANDLLKHLKKKKYKSFELVKLVANKDSYFEHTSIAIARKDKSFDDFIVLDAWRNSGELFFIKVKDDKKYKWEIR